MTFNAARRGPSVLDVLAGALRTMQTWFPGLGIKILALGAFSVLAAELRVRTGLDMVTTLVLVGAPFVAFVVVMSRRQQ
jgi:hypothetical protein